MHIIEIKALPNGSHDNQIIHGDMITVPEGWAVVPDDMILPETYPFVNVEVVNGVVTSMTPGIVPQKSDEPDSPTQLDRIEAQVTYTAMMTDTLLEV